MNPVLCISSVIFLILLCRLPVHAENDNVAKAHVLENARTVLAGKKLRWKIERQYSSEYIQEFILKDINEQIEKAKSINSTQLESLTKLKDDRVKSLSNPIVEDLQIQYLDDNHWLVIQTLVKSQVNYVHEYRSFQNGGSIDIDHYTKLATMSNSSAVVFWNLVNVIPSSYLLSIDATLESFSITESLTDISAIARNGDTVTFEMQNGLLGFITHKSRKGALKITIRPITSANKTGLPRLEYLTYDSRGRRMSSERWTLSAISELSETDGVYSQCKIPLSYKIVPLDTTFIK